MHKTALTSGLQETEEREEKSEKHERTASRDGEAGEDAATPAVLGGADERLLHAHDLSVVRSSHLHIAAFF